MATRIPLPGNGGDALQRGVEQGTGLWQQMMGHGVNLGRMHQQGQQFDKTHVLHEKQLEQAMVQHMQNLALHQQQEKRLQQAANQASQLHPFQIENLKASIAQHQAKTKDMARKSTLLESLLNQGGFGQNQNASMQEMPQEQPAEPFSMGEGMQPGFNAFGGQNMQPPAPPPMEAVKNGFGNLSGPQADFVKSQTGFNPHAESPQERRQSALEEKIKFEHYKQNKPVDYTKPTQSTITENQGIITAANSVLPTLEKLRNEETYSFFAIPSGGKAKYKTRAGISTDKLMTALKLPKQKESIELVKQMTTRQPNESGEEFIERVQLVIDEIEENRGLANQVLTTSKVKPTIKKEDDKKSSPLEESNKNSGKEEPIYNIATGEWE